MIKNDRLMTIIKALNNNYITVTATKVEPDGETTVLGTHGSNLINVRLVPRPENSFGPVLYVEEFESEENWAVMHPYDNNRSLSRCVRTGLGEVLNNL